MEPVSDYVGVDVSKAHLDLALAGSKLLRVANSPAGLERLRQQLAGLSRPHLVCEATGSYTRLMARDLAAHGIALSTVNPRRVRELARADGQWAKTDAIDARAILRFAQRMQPAPAPYEPAAIAMTDLVRRRRQLVDMLVMEKQRLEHPQAEPARASIQAHIGFLTTQLGELDARIATQIAQNEVFRRRAELLCSIPGIGAVTAAVLIAEMPELGCIANKQAAALAGVAPFVRESGQMRAQAHIAGGRLSVRCALYMATISAIRANPPIKRFYRRLRDQGKPAKLAIVAAMRKLLTIANAIIANDKPWSITRP